ncbi:MAG: ATPase [Pseudorhodoplanes sp.]|nr:ATPase [Pseudorhodoplanes sp.]
MREILDDIEKGNPLDPMESARRNMRTPLRKRFYKDVTVESDAQGHRILLDGKILKTPSRRPVVVPTRALADAIAEEWRAQKETIDPLTMPLTRLGNTVIDGVIDAQAAVAADIRKYLGSDLLCYRADGPEALIARQQDVWDPILGWAREALGARFVLAQGVNFVPQPEQAVNAACRAIPENPWALGAVHAAMTITGSALIALGMAQGVLTPEQAWNAALVDEDWNAQTWGRDPQVVERNAQRFAELKAAADLLKLAR